MPPPFIPGACLVLTRINFSYHGDSCLSQRQVESNVFFLPKLLPFPGYECELGDVDHEVTAERERDVYDQTMACSLC